MLAASGLHRATMQSSLVIGDTLRFLKSAPAYPPADGWTMKIRLVPRAGGSAQTLTATPEGSEYLFNVPPATTSQWTPGEYGWSSWVEKTGARYTLETGGQLTVLPDPASVAAGTDLRSRAQKALDDARAALAAWKPTKRSYTIGGRSWTFNSKADIVGVIHYWEGEVAKEDVAAGRSREFSGRIFSRL